MPEKPLVPYKALKQKQKARIADWMYRETLQFFLQYQRMPKLGLLWNLSPSSQSRRKLQNLPESGKRKSVNPLQWNSGRMIVSFS